MNSVLDYYSRLTRRGILAQTPVALACGALRGAPAFAQSDEKAFVEVKTVYGRVRGVRRGGLATFKGVPYGGSVSGGSRFKAAPPLKPWSGVREAL